MANKKLALDDVAYILPSDILFLIFIKVLLVKSLLRFKSVSKSWNAIISSNEFKRTHRDQSKALGCEKLLLHKINSTNEFEFRDLETSQLVMMAKEIFPPEKFRKATVLCSCDCLVLLKNPRANKDYVLCNPCTGEYQTLVCPYFNYKDKVPNACGICYDSSVDDYKVILIYKSSYGIYSLKKNCWSKKKSSLSNVVRVLQNCSLSEGISTGGCVFWSYFDYFVESNSTNIYFDGNSDELKELPAPDFVRENDFFGLATLKSCLSLYGGDAQSLALDIWIMEGDRWKLLMKVYNLPTICKTFIKDKVLLCCTRNGEIVFQQWTTLRLFIYNPRQQLLTESQISKDYSKNGDLPVISTCLDSLYFPSREERPPDFLFGILIRLPVKSLLRFQSVSKPWNAIISDNKFKKSHRDQSKALGREKLLLNHVQKDVFEFRDLESSQLILMEKRRFPLKTFQLAESLCSCDGLVLLKNPNPYKNPVLWNPSTGDYRYLSTKIINPPNHWCYNYRPQNVRAYGLCYHSTVGDYKVILIYDSFYAVHSLVNNSWITKASFPCPIGSLPSHNNASMGISTEGRVFWSLDEREIKQWVDSASAIIYFDAKSKSNEVKKLPSPDFIGEKDLFCLTSLKDCLSLYGSNIKSDQLDIWIMEQYGKWKRLMNICKLPTICKTFIKDRTFLCCTRNGEVLFQGLRDLRLYIYNPRTQLLSEAQESKVASICLDTLYFSSRDVKCKRKRAIDDPLTTHRRKVRKQ